MKMKRKTPSLRAALAVLLSLLLACSLALAENAEEPAEEIPGTLDMPGAGIKYVPPEEFRELKGACITNGTIEIIPGMSYACWLYCGLPEEEAAFLSEDPEKLANTPIVDLFYVFSIGNSMTFDTLNSILTNPLPTEYVQSIGKAGTTNFYLYMPPEDGDFVKAAAPEYGEEYRKLAALSDKVAAAFTCYEPVDPLAALVGQKAEFTVTDMEGNPVSSAEIFAQNEVTMLNFWATWCGPCKAELPELQKISLRLQEKGCNVVGLLTDNKPETAAKLLEENGITYPVYYAPADLSSFFQIEAIPTTFFIGRDGTILCTPVVGAQVSAYESIVEDLLKGN